jgi:hypothetical protein
MQISGLALDASAEAGKGGGDAGRTLLLCGLALTAAGIVVALLDGRVGDASDTNRLRRVATVSAPLVLLALVGGTATAASSGRSTSTEHAAEHAADADDATPTTAHTHAQMTGGGEHTHEDVPVTGVGAQVVDAETRAQLAAELVVARDATAGLTTVADALAAGFVPAGSFTDGAGAHFMNSAYMVGEFDAARPNALIADGDSPDSRIVGAMYTSIGTAAPPEGFAGPYDEWHQHQNVCFIQRGDVIEVPFPADRDITQQMCDDVAGEFMETTVWMVHAWVVPGWESPQGVFSHDHAQLQCRPGSEVDERGFCPGT